MEWLSTPEGPELIDTHSDPPTTPDMAMAVGLDPDHLYQNPPRSRGGDRLDLQTLLHTYNALQQMPHNIIGDYLEGSSKEPSKALSPLPQHLRARVQSFPYAGDNPFYVDVSLQGES